jgi:GMP synthase (glutamine-hydrolysing)
MRARLLVIQHEDDAPGAWFAEWIEAVGVRLDVTLGHRGDIVPETLSEYDGLVVLGGEMGAYDDDRHPWLTRTKQLIARTAAAGKPFLGICLGHQLAAVALGGTVERNPGGRALGLTPVRLTPAGRTDPLLQAVQHDARAVQWNDDIVTTLPPGSTLLAVAPDGTVQAARFGASAWGVQFHPEVSPEVFARWGSSVGPPEPAGAGRPLSDPAAIADAAREIADAEPELRAAWQPLAVRFADLVAGS